MIHKVFEQTLNPKFYNHFVCVSGSEISKGDSRVRVLSGGRQLQISSVEKADASSYTCLASSIAGSAMKEYNLQVYGTFFSLSHYSLQALKLELDNK